MLFKAKIRCPRCQGSRCRSSRWLSLEEKRNHPHDSPYRCLDCSHRFLVHEEAAAAQGRAIPLSLALVAIVIAVGVTLLLMRSPAQVQAGDGEATLVLLDPEIKMAAEAGDAGAQYRLGEALLRQPGHTPETSTQAMRWLQLSAENGNTEAMLVLGRLTRTGVGILQNFGQAAKWLQTAATRGNPEGMLELGRLYRDGIGVDKDLVHAYVWFNRASAARNLDAVRERELIARMLTAEELGDAQDLSSSPLVADAKPGDEEGASAPGGKAAGEREAAADVQETVSEAKAKVPDVKGKPTSRKSKAVDAQDKK